MKVGVIFLSLILLMQFSSANVEVFNITVNDISSSLESISGEINLSIVQEGATTLISSNSGEQMTLKEFLEKTGTTYECIPSDCSSRYTKTSEDPVEEVIRLKPGEKKILGFALTGMVDTIIDLHFDFASSFDESVNMPLSAIIFENEKWEFDKFSTDVFSLKNWGCFDNTNSLISSIGSRIGPSPFCEDVYLTRTNKVRAGAKIDRLSDGLIANLTMSLHYKSSGDEVGTPCTYNPDEVAEGKEYCDIKTDSGEFFPEGEYKICISSSNGSVTKWRIFNESSGNICGSILNSPFVPNLDYSIYVQTVKYADSNSLGEIFDDEKLGDDEDIGVLELANAYISGDKYHSDCSDTCILPIELMAGIQQDFIIEDPFLQYQANGAYPETTSVYNITETPAKINYEGVLNLGALDFHIPESMDYEISIGDTKIFNKSYNISSAPKINLIVPKSVPAGVPIEFTADVDFNGDRQLIYTWDFDDGTTNQTTVNYIEHTYYDLRNYTIKLKVDAGNGLFDEKSFDNIEAITPRSAIESSLAQKRGVLASLQEIIDAVPSWYKQALSDTAGMESTVNILSSIEKSQQAATVDSDFVMIARDLYRLDIPSSIEIESYSRPYLTNTPNDVNIAPISESTGDMASSSNEDYKEPIISWQNKNIEGSVSTKTYEVKTQSEESLGSMSAYVFEIKSNAVEESYFVINKKLSDLHFSASVGATQVSDYSMIPIQALGEKDIEFYYSGSEPISYFISPRLSSITVESGIDTTCNYNFICEKGLGENPANCRSDCLPTNKLILYVLLIIFGGIGVYTLLGLWYNKHYEKYLFKDSRELYNILMFVSNAKSRGMNDGKIASNLKRQGWSGERVSYIIKKANGRRTGLPEIIPISKISAKIRNAKMRKQSQNNVMTDPRQQPPQNINKSRFAR